MCWFHHPARTPACASRDRLVVWIAIGLVLLSVVWALRDLRASSPDQLNRRSRTHARKIPLVTGDEPTRRGVDQTWLSGVPHHSRDSRCDRSSRAAVGTRYDRRATAQGSGLPWGKQRRCMSISLNRYWSRSDLWCEGIRRTRCRRGMDPN